MNVISLLALSPDFVQIHCKLCHLRITIDMTSKGLRHLSYRLARRAIVYATDLQYMSFCILFSFL